ncbi:uncharacterized protein LOC110861902 [Folsomia candida]|uniref:uncharacterized protein LOC110861902 n=1 Tax=Folsomia candida TaxID=158441 RepID=UPI000B90782A|nr:uncharacterized protein LOC110861902 [Folsomia candida]
MLLYKTVRQVSVALRDVRNTVIPATATSGSIPTVVYTNVRLPKLEIQPFHGNYLEWATFKDSFEAAVHSNASVSKVEKFTYLKALLKGEAGRYTADLPLTDAHYDQAWKQLHDRYENKRMIAFATLDKFCSQPKATATSKSVKDLIDAANRCIRSMELLHCNLDVHAEQFYIYHIASKLDPAAKDLWEHSLKDNDIIKLADLISFLERHAMAFWEIEKLQDSQLLSAEEKRCEDHFKNTVQRTKEGEFIVKYPFKTPKVQLGESLNIAINRFKQVERRLHKNEHYVTEYKKFMDDYIKLGHMIEVPPPNKDSNFRCYLPHHFVLKESSTTTKFRVVFDASAKTSNGLSLNDTMMVGPTVQDTLANLIMRFRKHKIAINADIEKMYRQILVSSDDQEFQHIVWRESPDQPFKHYKLLTITYGTAAGPYLATRVLSELANQVDVTIASQVLQEDFYMDDLLSGADTEENAVKLQHEIIELLKRCGMSIRKFTSNSEKVLLSIPEDLTETKSLTFDKDATVKTLGIYWNPAQDCFGFRADIFGNVKVGSLTKRVILSEISKLFDPIGWCAPIIISAKILMQSIWKANLNWDDLVPITIQQKAQVGHSGKNQQTYLVGFSDASEQAYSAVVYLVYYDEQGNGLSYLVSSKTRVAPVKQQSLPRLELCGALLLAEFMPLVAKALKMNFTDMVAYTDSTLTLGWIRSEPYKYKTFVANRITKIQELIPGDKWGFVRGIDNPADCTSRGISVQEFINHPLWWNGPSWLNEKPPVPNLTS